ncbi:MAG: FAD binding domain-containing protein [Deltaproteobacteria bacterium]|nr:FAD binding domain-containing protein [Deltaproteobacteria bacterium]
MMRAPRFRYVAARSVGEAARALADDPGAMLLAGGTDVVPGIKRRQHAPSLLVSLRRVPELRGIRWGDDGGLELGACVTLSEIVEDGRVAQSHAALWRAAAQVATPQIRNAGTVGGNLCLDTRCNYYDQSIEWRRAIGFCMKAPGPGGTARTEKAGGVCWVALSSPKCKAVSSTDLAPALIALGARVTLASTGGERRIPLEELYADDGMAFTTRRHDELLTAIHVPPPAARTRSTYWKLRRRGAFDFPVLGVAGALRVADDGTVEAARIVLGAVASKPVVVDATSLLVGGALTDDAIDAFEEKAARFARPLDNTDFDLHWRKRVARAYLTGVLCELRGDDPASLGLLQRRAAAMVPAG